MANSTEKDQSNVVRGLKAAINNPRVSDEAKEHDKERLRSMGEEVSGGSNGGESTRVLAGYKAALKNPNVGEEAKEHAREVLKENGAL